MAGREKNIGIDNFIADIGGFGRGIRMIHPECDLYGKTFPQETVFDIDRSYLVDDIRVFQAAVKACQQDVVGKVVRMLLQKHLNVMCYIITDTDNGIHRRIKVFQKAVNTLSVILNADGACETEGLGKRNPVRCQTFQIAEITVCVGQGIVDVSDKADSLAALSNKWSTTCFTVYFPSISKRSPVRVFNSIPGTVSKNTFGTSSSFSRVSRCLS